MSGGKAGGSGGGLQESPDDLKSTSYAQVLDLISEGEIGGLVDGLKSIYLDDTPIQNPDGSNNFSGVSYVSVNGTQDQASIVGFDQVSNEISVGTEAKISTGPVVRTVTNTNVTSVSVTVQLPQLSFMDSNGKLGGTTIHYAIDIQVDGGGWVTKIDESLTGKTTGGYERQYRINLPTGTTRQVRLRRITADSTSSQLNNKTYFKSYTEIIDAKLRYPNSALVGVKVDASQFRSIPKRGYDVKLLKVKFPTNATVRADGSLSYTGVWDGTFQVGWCADPAWAYYDILTNTRYGLGRYIDTSQIDKWALYSASQYCSELVSDGFGGTEPRFTINAWWYTREEAFKFLNDMTSIFRGMAYWATGSVTTVQDAPTDPTYLYTNANVVDGMFTYQGTSAKSRHTVALVTWNDPGDLYRQKVEYVEDVIGIARFGVIETEVVAIGCTSRGQAHRVGKWLLYSERLETEVVGFKTGAEGILCRPGDVIKIADRHRTGNRIGGRIKAATSTQITVDAISTVPAGTLTLYTMTVDGLVQTNTVSTIVGNVITVVGSMATIPMAQSAWALTSAAGEVRTYRVLTVSEGDNGEYEIAALEHDPGKYDLVENGITLEPRVYGNLNPIPDTPTSLTLTENTYSFQNTTRSKITVDWALSANATSYLLQWREDNGNFTSVAVYSNSYELLDTHIATYDFRVTAMNRIGTPSPDYAEATITTVGNAAAPSAPTSLTATGVVNAINLAWDNGGQTSWSAEIYENTVNNSATATLIATVTANVYSRTGLTAADGIRYYWIKLINTQNVRSGFSNTASATAISVTTGLQIILSKPTANLPAYADGNILSFADAVGVAAVYSGGNDVTSSATLSAVATGCVGTINTAANTPVAGQPMGYYQVTALSSGVNNATLKITATVAGQTTNATFVVNRAIQGIEIVSSLPTTNLFSGRIVYLTTDQKLWRYNGGGWTTAVPANDITGTVTDAQIAGLAAAKITGQITSTQITDGAISSPKIAAGAIVAGKIAAGTIQASDIAANAITAGQIAAGTITANELAASSVTTDKIFAGAVTAATLAASNVITATAQIGDLLVDTIKVKDGAITDAGQAYNGSTLTGNGSYQTAVSYNVTLNAPGDIIALAAVAQAFPSGDRVWNIQLVIDGTVVFNPSGAKTMDSISLMGKKTFGAGLTYPYTATVTLNWLGQNSGVSVAAGGASLAHLRRYTK